MSSLELAPGRWIGPQHPCFVIAEIGQNHQGSMEEAKKLIDAAVSAGVDCVKFQKTSLPDKFAKSCLERPYTSPHSWGKTYGEHKGHLELTEDEFWVLKSYAEDRNVVFTASAKDIPSLHFLVDLGVPFVKLGSTDPEDHLLLKETAKCGLPLVISTGMQEMATVRQVYKTVKKVHAKFVFLHCISSYPAPPEDVNLKVIEKYREEFPDINVGYSGHELGTAISIAAVALGAKVIERHITLDKSQKGSDHACSLLPAEFKSLVTDIRTVEKALGDGNKKFVLSEQLCHQKLRKSLVAAEDLPEGTVLTEANINVKVSHPHGIAAVDFQKVIGVRLRRCKEFDEPIQNDDLIF